MKAIVLGLIIIISIPVLSAEIECKKAEQEADKLRDMISAQFTTPGIKQEHLSAMLSAVNGVMTNEDVRICKQLDVLLNDVEVTFFDLMTKAQD